MKVLNRVFADPIERTPERHVSCAYITLVLSVHVSDLFTALRDLSGPTRLPVVAGASLDFISPTAPHPHSHL